MPSMNRREFIVGSAAAAALCTLPLGSALPAIQWEPWDSTAAVFEGEEVLVRWSGSKTVERATAYVGDEIAELHMLDEDGEDEEVHPDFIARTGDNPRMTVDGEGDTIISSSA